MTKHTPEMNISNNFKQPEALVVCDMPEMLERLADEGPNWQVLEAAAGDIRRLRAENERLWKEREEPYRTVEMYLRECNRLEKERDQLLEALQTCIDYGSMTGGYWVTAKATAAIAKVEGKAT